MKAKLVLESGRVFRGEFFGAAKEIGGEVVFNTGMTGYQETLTDPSYCSQIITMTYPLIGNYGINTDDNEAIKPAATGMVVRELCQEPSNWRSKSTLDNFMIDNDITGIHGVDTRALTRCLREAGTMRGMIVADSENTENITKKCNDIPWTRDMDLVSQVTTTKEYSLSGNKAHVAVMDLGAKSSIINNINQKGHEVTVLRAKVTAEEILAKDFKGIILSNGPGDPKQSNYATETVKKILGKIPIFGICLGHQLLSLACGCKTYKLKYGHRGANHPVKDLATNKVYITSQNHGFVVDEDSLSETDVFVTHRNLNDNTIEGIRHKKYQAYSVQYHPEASPGPQDSAYLLDDFLSSIS